MYVGTQPSRIESIIPHPINVGCTLYLPLKSVVWKGVGESNFAVEKIARYSLS